MSDTLDKVFIDNSGQIRAYGNPKGIVQEIADLPTSDISENDVYSVLSEDGAYYYYNGLSWNKVGGTAYINGSGESTDLTEIKTRITAIETTLESAVFYKEVN